MTIGDKIKNRRLQLEYSQEELAKLVGYNSKSSINKIELGVHGIPAKMIPKFAQALHCDPQYFIEWDKPQRNPEELNADLAIQDFELIEKVSRLNPVNNQRVMDYIDVLLENQSYKKS